LTNQSLIHTGDNVEFDNVDSHVEMTCDIHSCDKNHPLSTKSTELNMFNFGHATMSTATSRRCDSLYKVEFHNIKVDKVQFDIVTSVYWP